MCTGQKQYSTNSIQSDNYVSNLIMFPNLNMIDNRSTEVLSQIEVDGITFGYTPHKPIVEIVSIKIPKGGFVALLGPSGSGKPTLLKTIIGLQKP